MRSKKTYVNINKRKIKVAHTSFPTIVKITSIIMKFKFTLHFHTFYLVQNSLMLAKRAMKSKVKNKLSQKNTDSSHLVFQPYPAVNRHTIFMIMLSKLC